MFKHVLMMVCWSASLAACKDSTAVADKGLKGDSWNASTDSGHADAAERDTLNIKDAGSDMTPLVGLFVHSANGQDLPGLGTILQPFKTIQYAIDQAQTPITIHVAAGIYLESIALRDQIALLGGYHASDWSDRDYRAWDDPAHRTAIMAAGSIAVRAGKGVGNTTLIEGFYLEGGIETHDHHSHGMYIYDSATPIIRGNKIHGGYGDTYSTGISTFSDAAPTITHNVIQGGSASITYALRLNETTSLVANNLLSGLAGSIESYGVLVNNASPVIVNNTIEAGTATAAYGVFLFSATAPEISNNIVIAAGTEKGYGLYEATLTGDVAQLKNNDLFGCTTALYHDWGGSPANILDIAALHSMSDTTASGNINVDPAFVSPTDQHLQQTSPVEVREGGLDQSALGIETDLEGNPRTIPWSMGAYEHDQP